MADQRQEARKIIADVARAIDRRLSVEVREVPGQERLQLTLTHGTHHGQIEVAMPAILAAGDNPMARNELRLRLKRATDTMLFRPMPDSGCRRYGQRKLAPKAAARKPPIG